MRRGTILSVHVSKALPHFRSLLIKLRRALHKPTEFGEPETMGRFTCSVLLLASAGAVGCTDDVGTNNDDPMVVDYNGPVAASVAERPVPVACGTTSFSSDALGALSMTGTSN